MFSIEHNKKNTFCSPILADVTAELVCEKIDEKWSLHLTHIGGGKVEAILGKNYSPEECLDVSELIPSEDFSHHQAIVESILNQGPGHHSADWNLFLNSMSDRPPVSILNPIKKTIRAVNIRLQFHENKTNEMGRKYYFHVLFIDRNLEELCAISMLNQSEHYQYLFHRLEETVRLIPNSSSLQDLQGIVRMGKNLASEDYRDFLPENLQAKLFEKRGGETEKTPSLSLFCGLNDWISQQKRFFLEAKLPISLEYSPINPTRNFLISREKIQSFQLVLLYMFKVSLKNPIHHQIHFVANQQLLKNDDKYFECDIHDTDSLCSVYQLLQPSKVTEMTAEQENFIQACEFWRNEGGGIDTWLSQDSGESVVRLSLFSHSHRLLKPQNEKTHLSSTEQFEIMLHEMDAHRKRSVLLVDDGLLSIKFLLKHTLSILRLGAIPTDSPSNRLGSAEKWAEMGFFVLSYPDWSIVCASDGSVAESLLEKFNPDVIITDENMPNKNGTELIRWFRTHRPDQMHVRIALHSSDKDKPWKDILEPLNAMFFEKANSKMFDSIFDFSCDWSYAAGL